MHYNFLSFARSFVRSLVVIDDVRLRTTLHARLAPALCNLLSHVLRAQAGAAHDHRLRLQLHVHVGDAVYLRRETPHGARASFAHHVHVKRYRGRHGARARRRMTTPHAFELMKSRKRHTLTRARGVCLSSRSTTVRRGARAREVTPPARRARSFARDRRTDRRRRAPGLDNCFSRSTLRRRVTIARDAERDGERDDAQGVRVFYRLVVRARV